MELVEETALGACQLFREVFTSFEEIRREDSSSCSTSGCGVFLFFGGFFLIFVLEDMIHPL